MNIFTKHPQEAGFSYAQHLFFALGIVKKLVVAAFCCSIHAFLPFCFTYKTGTIVADIHKSISHTKGHDVH